MDLQKQIEELKKEFNEKVKKLESQIKSNNEDWVEKILNELWKKLPNKDYESCKRLIKNENVSDYPYYFKALLKYIIQACADLLNEEPIDWKNENQEKCVFYYDNIISAVDICKEYNFNHCNVPFINNTIEKAQEILSNLNGLNILEMYYKGV